MANCTAMAYLGMNPWNKSGIEIMHMARLYEGFAMDLCIERKTTWNEDGKMLGIFRCTTDNTMDDLMLLGAVYALQDEQVIAACKAAGMPVDTIKNRWEMYDSDQHLPKPYELAKAAYARTDAAMIITAFQGSTLTRQMDAAKDYDVKLELCETMFKREGESAWG